MTEQTKEFDLSDAKERLARHAAGVGAMAPEVLLSEDGGPSTEVKNYCKANNLTVDWVYLGAQPKYRPGDAIDQRSDTLEEKGESKMNYNGFYAVKRKTDHIDRLYRIINLSMIGAAATDTTYNIDNLLDAHLAVYETIHALASEGVEIAEMAKRRQEAAETTLQAAE